jgi:cobalt-zinc-cadmium efflux system membrane fusion protein
MIHRNHTGLRAALAGLAIFMAASCGGGAESEHEAASAEYERGPHNGRMLRDGDFALEMTIFEDGVPPEFHIYAYRDNRPVDPREVELTVSLTRLGGQVDSFIFAPQEDYLKGSGVVTEPHSFDVAVRAVSNGETHDWAYQSYEGRTTIGAAQAEAAGIRVEAAGTGNSRRDHSACWSC